MIAIVAAILIISSVQYAQAEPTQIIQGSIDGTFVSIIHDGITNIIKLEKDGITSEHYDGVIKTYNSGGFVIKNIESGIVLFAHPIGNEQYRLVVVTNDNVYRLIGVSSEFTQEDAVTSSSSLYDEPVSSVGSDITNWDIPDDLDRDDGEDTFLMALKSSQTYNSIQLGDKFEFDGSVYSVRNNTGIMDVDISFEISRDNLILRSVETKSGVGGTIHVETGDMIYPLFYPNFCYDVKITMNHGEYTTVWTDDFVMTYSGIWNPNMDWIAESSWNYLPQTFRDEPRVSVNADEHCN